MSNKTEICLSNRSKMSLIPFGRFRFKKFDFVFVHILMVSASVRHFTANVYEPKAQSDKTKDYFYFLV